MELFSTSDGGITWNRVSLPRTANSKINSIYYLPSLHRLFVAVWPNSSSPASAYSDDDGSTWNVLNTSYGDTGFGFINNTVGILASDCSMGCGWSRTTDGGATWSQDQNKVHCWQPQALPWTSTFVALTDNYGDVVRSTDAGVTWSTISTLPYTIGGSTGDLEVDSCGNLYCQATLNTGFGFRVSEDGGATWSDLGGPDGVVDSRFCVAERDIYAASGNTLWVLRRSSFTDQGRVKVPTACSTVDTTLSFLYSGCNSLTLLSVTSSDTVSLLPHLEVPVVMPPHSGCAVRFTIGSISGGPDSVLVHYAFERLGQRYDTTFVVGLLGVPEQPVLSKLEQLQFPTIQACDSITRPLTFSNLNCSELTLDSIRLEAPFFIDPSALPANVSSGASVEIGVTYVPDGPGNVLSYARIFYHTSQGIHRDTTLQITSAATDAPIYELSLDASPISEVAGTLTPIPIFLHSPSSPAVLLASGINSLDASLALNTDLLSFESVTSTISGVTVTPLRVTSTGIALRIQFPTGFDPVFVTEIARINCTAVLSDSLHSSIRITNFSLPSHTTTCSRLRVPQGICNFDMREQCGDSLLSSYLRMGSFAIEGAHPNPSSQIVQFHLRHVPTSGNIALEILDALGRVIRRCETTIINPSIDVTALEPGAYVVRATAGGKLATTRFEVVR